jgi:hypothetical protein
MSLTKLSLAGNNSNILGQEEFVSDIPAGDGKTATFFTVYHYLALRVYHRKDNSRVHRILIVRMHGFYVKTLKWKQKDDMFNIHLCFSLGYIVRQM